MLNLLPLFEKKNVLTEYRMRLAVVAVFALSFLVFASLALLASSYFRAFSKQNIAEKRIAELTGKSATENAQEEKATEAKIKEINKKVELLLAKGPEDPVLAVPSEAFSRIFNRKTTAIKIFSISYSNLPDRTRFVVTGLAGNRESLASFVEALKKESTFNRVDLPISSYVKSMDIDFSIVLERIQESAKTTTP
ncbi:MAG: hypothetical protein UY07_C0048G0008 [Parcubacteria group bacterium GW2011_GWA1_47_8]|nr:MAG: hypothetical protein UY07_C0048G0008 [Parcubacteria group bacterium GW2011_GWA1_47_8]